MKLKGIGEDRIIQGISKRFSKPGSRLIKGIGDDASVTTEIGGRHLLTTTDTLIEGTHFKKSWTTPYLLGRKALSISLSDVAAMGGSPLFYLVSIALGADTEKKFLDELYRGLSDCGKKYGALLAGGNTARTAGRISVSTTLIGEVPEDETVFRSGARPGDVIYVTGNPGDAALGLRFLKRYGIAAIGKSACKRPVSRFLDPAARMNIGGTLAKRRLATAMIDISDGLMLDLERLCRESSVGAGIDARKLPLSAALKGFFKGKETEAQRMALSGGEDYELLFTARPENAKKILALSSRETPITPIGIISRAKGLCVTTEHGRTLKVKKAGFEHF